MTSVDSSHGCISDLSRKFKEEKRKEKKNQKPNIPIPDQFNKNLYVRPWYGNC
jgi:hypothetical protein